MICTRCPSPGNYREGESDSKKAAEAYDKKVEAYNAARNGDNPLPDPGEFADPGKAKRARAREILADARKARNEAAESAKSAVTAAMAHAPKEPRAGTNSRPSSWTMRWPKASNWPMSARGSSRAARALSISCVPSTRWTCTT
ncbi:putative T7SS-secreted protein [Streptomyces pristinaespiralis]|uniref:putative T7SS-secreted protein n=1 Tax=Streptomyces pristinaespiralis TaxID=38300 RepID=UPI0033E56B08